MAAVTSPEPAAEWHPFDYDNKAATAPPENEMVWVVEAYYERGVTVGLFDGFTFRVLPSGTDDCQVTHWAPMTRPGAAVTSPEPVAARAVPPAAVDEGYHAADSLGLNLTRADITAMLEAAAPHLAAVQAREG